MKTAKPKCFRKYFFFSMCKILRSVSPIFPWSMLMEQRWKGVRIQTHQWYVRENCKRVCRCRQSLDFATRNKADRCSKSTLDQQKMFLLKREAGPRLTAAFTDRTERHALYEHGNEQTYSVSGRPVLNTFQFLLYHFSRVTFYHIKVSNKCWFFQVVV